MPDYSRLKRVKFLLLDMDGTIYLAKELFSFTNPFLEKMQKIGMPYLFLTNNSSISTSQYMNKLENIGVLCSEHGVFSSADAAKLYLANEGYKKLYLLGTPGLEDDFRDSGFILSESAAEAVVLAFDKTLTYEKLQTANNMLLDGLPYFATHPDLVCPYSPHPIPDTGAMIKLLEASSGRTPLIIGKPSKIMFEMIMRKYELKPEETAMIGDRLSTDIRFANENGAVSILVLSGETDERMLKESDVQPHFVFDDLAALGNYL